jgi:hypothetical protein
MSKRVRFKAVRRPSSEGRDTRSSGKPDAVKVAQAYAKMMGEEFSDAEVERVKFFIDFGYAPKKGEDLKELRATHEKWARERDERKSSPEPVYQHRTYHEQKAIESSGCNGHHHYHQRPYDNSLGRSDTYAASTCCGCGQSEPNPYENERR